MEDKIIEVDSHEQNMKDMQIYSLYVLMHRCIPSIKDGLKPVQRRILYTMQFELGCTSLSRVTKSSRIVGDVMGKFHPHGDSSIYDAMKVMTNWFESPIPLITNQGNFGTFQGDPASKMRYTEAFISKFASECVIGDMIESRHVVDYTPNFDGSRLEPDFLATKVPLLLINGAFSIAIYTKVEVPHHSLNDVIDATLTLLHNPKAKICLIPDNCMPAEIVETDFQAISNKGFGYYTVRGIINTLQDKKTGQYTLQIASIPDHIYSNGIKKKIEDLIKDGKLIQIDDIQEESKDDRLDLRIILKKGSDPEYVKNVLYKNTDLQVNQRVNMEILDLDTEDGMPVKNISYKAYILYFLEMRRNIKFRLYNFKLQNVRTRLHEIDTYIKILESGDVENIIHAIRNQKAGEESVLIEWLMKKLKITDLQAKFILNTEIKKLSKAHLNKYKEEQARLIEEVNKYIHIITHEELIDQEIEAELLDIKQRYWSPRKTVIIKESEATGIPEGQFKIVITEANYIKKLEINQSIKAYKGDEPKYVVIADNTKDLLLFDENGKVFKLPVHKIAFTDNNSTGIDIRLLLKNLTSNIVSVMYLPILETLANKKSKYYIATVSSKGMIKRMDLNDIINATPSGIIYSKLNHGDRIKDIVIANHKHDIIIYSKNKALRLPIESLPYLKRSTIGNKALSGNHEVDGMCVITPDVTDVIVITTKGKANRFSINALPLSDRGKAGNSVIKLLKGDSIASIFSCSRDCKIRAITTEGIVEFGIDQIPVGSSISAGSKIIKGTVIKCELIK